MVAHPPMPGLPPQAESRYRCSASVSHHYGHERSGLGCSSCFDYGGMAGAAYDNDGSSLQCDEADGDYYSYER